MQTIAGDTTLTAEARQLAGVRQQTPAERLAAAFGLAAYVRAASREAIRRAQPQLTPLERARLLLELTHGPAAAAQLSIAPNEEAMIDPSYIPTVLVPVVEAFDDLQISYCVGGSVASSAWALPRATNDIDLLADVQNRHIAPLVARLSGAYYIHAPELSEAIRTRGSFNLLHNATSFRVDIFLPDGSPYSRIQLTRARDVTLPATSRPIRVASPEDMILQKLRWYRLTQGVRDSQWTDVQGILRVQGDAIDRAYLERWAPSLGIEDLLPIALRGDRPPPPAPDVEQRRMF